MRWSLVTHARGAKDGIVPEDEEDEEVEEMDEVEAIVQGVIMDARMAITTITMMNVRMALTSIWERANRGEWSSLIHLPCYGHLKV